FLRQKLATEARMSAFASVFPPAPAALDTPPLARLRSSARYRSIAFRRCEKEREPICKRDWMAMERTTVSILTWTSPSREFFKESRWEITSFALARPRKRFNTD